MANIPLVVVGASAGGAEPLAARAFAPHVPTGQRGDPGTASENGDEILGVLLSGMLNDGTAGLGAMKRTGGHTIVQQPQDAVFAEMPRSALAAMRVDAVLPAHRIATAIADWAWDQRARS